MRYKLILLTGLLLFINTITTGSGYIYTIPVTHGETDNEALAGYCSAFFLSLRGNSSKPDYEVFNRAFTGFLNLKAGDSIRNNILTVIDFTLSSRLERMWVIDMDKMEVIHTSLVAHGRNSGEEYATRFSNLRHSNQSSLGFYLTGSTYTGKHGLSLYLDGVEKGINDKARERTVVMHGADYVSNDFIRSYGRLGRSFGCPAIPVEGHEEVIKKLAGGSCIYIHHSDSSYQNCSCMFSGERALSGLTHLLHDHSESFSSN